MSRDGDFELVTLRNGSRAVRSLSLGEVMHPSVGPWKEANLLYVEQLELPRLLSTEAASPLTVLDVGLGAATNAAAALACAKELGAQHRRPLRLVSYERDLAPLRLALADPEGFPFLIPFADAARRLMRDGRWAEGNVEWLLREGELLPALAAAPEAGHVIYYDPFSPKSNPELWTVAALREMRKHCAQEGTLLATYSAATPTRVALLMAGFFVGKGAAIGTKQETTVAATRKELLKQPLGLEWLGRWSRSTARAPHGETDVPELATHAQFREG